MAETGVGIGNSLPALRWLNRIDSRGLFAQIPLLEGVPGQRFPSRIMRLLSPLSRSGLDGWWCGRSNVCWEQLLHSSMA